MIQRTMMVWGILALAVWTGVLGATPRAYVFEEVADEWSRAKGEGPAFLKEAGFEVIELPLNRSPENLEGLIYFGSFTSQHPRYQSYMRQYGAALHAFVRRGNVIVHMTQADQTESFPAVLAEPLKATRNDLDTNELTIHSPDHPLLRDVPRNGNKLALAGPRASWESLNSHANFEVIVSATGTTEAPALMEGAMEKGRVILSSIPFDKPAGAGGHRLDEAQRQAFARAFFRNLREHVEAVQQGNARPINVTPSALAMSEFTEGAWTLVALPDTQVYSRVYPGMFDLQTSWIRHNAQKRNIKYVLHLGDITDTNAPIEWERAARSMSLLHDVVPYALAFGNHDYGPRGNSTTRDTYGNEYFSYEEISKWETFGGALDKGKLDNTYHLFEAGGVKWIIISLEFGPSKRAVDWANKVMEAHPDREGILITHAYMFHDDTRYDHTKGRQNWNPKFYPIPGERYDGQELWDHLVKQHRFHLVLNGHVLGDGTGYMVSETERGTVCHQMLSNYQTRNLGGEGYMRLLEFQPDGKTVLVKSYTPLNDTFMLAPDQTFQIELKLDRKTGATR